MLHGRKTHAKPEPQFVALFLYQIYSESRASLFTILKKLHVHRYPTNILLSSLI